MNTLPYNIEKEGREGLYRHNFAILYNYCVCIQVSAVLADDEVMLSIKPGQVRISSVLMELNFKFVLVLNQ